MNASAANAEPECDTNVTGPGSHPSGLEKPVAQSSASRFRKPIPLPPQNAIPASRAIAARRCGSGGAPGSGGSSSYRLANVTADRAPARAAPRQRLLQPGVRDAEDRQVHGHRDSAADG